MKDYIRIADKNLMPNCPVTHRDILAAKDIFEPNLGSLKGKTVQQQGDVVELKSIGIPMSIMERYQKVTLAADIMMVNKIQFMMSISWHIKFGTGESLSNVKVPTLSGCMKHIHQLYMQQGFRVTEVLMDGQFEPLHGDLAKLGIYLNVVSANEHVPEIEHFIRTVKECARAIYNVLPFQCIPALMIIEMVSSCLLWLNNFPPGGGGGVKGA